MNRIASSFRDPSGFLFKSEGKIFRQINLLAQEDYDQLMSTGLYDYLIKKKLMVAHEEVANHSKEAYKTIAPEFIPLITYPYEWSFEQYKDAALLTLRLQKIALKHGMSLKDASSYNIQFLNGRPLIIDTLSFTKYNEGEPWVAYKQFCQHFLAPLALASYRDIRLTKLMSDFIDGIPLDLASHLLPAKTKFKFSIASHIHWHAKAQGKHADKAKDTKQSAKISKKGLLGIIASLHSTVNKLRWNTGDTEWGDYYNNTNYTDRSFQEKKRIISEMLDQVNGKSLWDLGANDGTFSMIGVARGMQTAAFDIDPIAVNKNYIKVRNEGIENMLPVLMDLTNPSANIGWAHEERDSLSARGKADCVMALALVHHLAISNNLPLERIAAYFSQLGKHLIIEFVPKEDSKVQTLLATREDIFPNYHLAGFEKAMEPHYEVLQKTAIQGSERTLYLLKNRT